METAVSTEQQPHEIVWGITNAVVASRALHVMADLGVDDNIAGEPVSAGELAERCGAHPDALDRVLRLLAAVGVFEAVDGGFGHTPASELLRSEHPMSMRGFPRMMTLQGMAATFPHLDYAGRTGAPAVEKVHPGGFWGYPQERTDD